MLLACPPPASVPAQNPGNLIPDFNPRLDGEVRFIALQADTKILISGNFLTVNGVSRPRAARLNPDGTLDPAFNPDPQTQRLLLLLRNQNLLAQTAQNRVIRLSTNGSVDASFPAIPAAFSYWEPPDGGLLAGDYYEIRRYHPSGIHDACFQVLVSGGSPLPLPAVTQLVEQAGRGLLIAGPFERVDSIGRWNIARLRRDDELDLTFAYSAELAEQRIAGVATNGTVIIGPQNSPPGFAYRLKRLDPNGQIQTNFTSQTDGFVTMAVSHLNDRVILGGEFKSCNGIARNGIARLNSDGTTDLAFNPGAGLQFANSSARASALALAVETTGTILAGGNFTRFAGMPQAYLARIVGEGSGPAISPQPAAPPKGTPAAANNLPEGAGDDDVPRAVRRQDAPAAQTPTNDFGALDQTFRSPVSTGELNPPRFRAVAVTPDNRIMVGGAFTILDGLPRKYLARLQTDGTVDSAYSPVLAVHCCGFRETHAIGALVADADGELVAAGTVINSRPGLILSWANYIVRFTADGCLDPSFARASWQGLTNIALARHADGRIVLAGMFTNVNGTLRSGLARLNVDGTLDQTFAPQLELDGPIHAVAVQNNGKILLGGDFTRVNGRAHARVARFLPDGSSDPTFIAGAGADAAVFALAALPNGDLVVAGEFASFAGVPCRALVLLDESGGVRLGLNHPELPARITAVAHQPDGRVILSSGTALFRVHPLASPVRLEDLRRVSQAMQFSIKTESARTYRLEFTDRLEERPVWVELTAFNGDGGTKTWLEPFGTNSQRFFRVRVR